ncbi:hypothetical protein A2U01_0105462, partial [Trifolium medium]|nr:hypothetical protein [Trifolium medium]
MMVSMGAPGGIAEITSGAS